jgi:Putative peptidoglycan binding domain/Peptidase family M23
MGQGVRSFALAAIAMVLLAGSAQFGDLVEYPLAFPVAGPHHYSDWFWSSRSHGVHHAQDIMADKMTPVVAAADGVIRLVNWSRDADPDRCCSIVLRHDDGWETRYIHLNNDTPGTDDGKGWGIADGIAPGIHVTAGTVLGWVGDSGNAEDVGPHLHFELLAPSGVYVNPFHALAQAGGNWLGWGAADPLFDGRRLLAAGDRGADVRRLQEVLGDLGISPGGVDGIFGPRTATAVKGFQIDTGLEADSVVGPATRTALDARYDPPTQQPNRILRKGDRGSDVMRLQQLLTVAGSDPGPADGIFGSKTHAAVEGFQQAAGLTVDGLVGSMTRKALGF